MKYIYKKNSHGKAHLKSRIQSSLLKMSTKFFIVTKKLRFFLFDLLSSMPGQFLPFCIWIFYTYIYKYFIYIFSVDGRRGHCEWLDRDKKNKDGRNPSLYAFRSSHHIYMPIKKKTRKKLLPKKNHL